MSECGLLPETQREDPEAWALCPTSPVTFKVTLGGNDLTVSCPVGCETWGHCKHIPEVCGFFADFWPMIAWSCLGFFSLSSVQLCLWAHEVPWENGCKIVGSSAINGISNSTIFQKKKQRVNINNAFSCTYHFQPICKNIYFFLWNKPSMPKACKKHHSSISCSIT